MKTHTPTPWKLGSSGLIILAGEGDKCHTVAGTHQALYNSQKEIDAAHIVHCVNNHDALCAALEGLLVAQNDMIHASDYLPSDKSRNLESAKYAARAVLAKVKEAQP